MNTTVRLNEEDFTKFKNNKEISVILIEDNSFAVTTAKVNESVTISNKNQALTGLVKRRIDTIINYNTKQLLMDIVLI